MKLGSLVSGQFRCVGHAARNGVHTATSHTDVRPQSDSPTIGGRQRILQSTQRDFKFRLLLLT
jgi:hypothetical protein